ncbi:MAG: hypothetical protein DSY80_00520 [Desulfocapsa sp.]|nr:MAG: hypothetical protein DSY80_00520 [Desulfocapsa sp.]
MNNIQYRVIWNSTINYIHPDDTPFSVDVDTIENAVRVMRLLAAYDKSRHLNGDGGAVDPYRDDFLTAGQLLMFTDRWVEWHDPETGEICPFQWVENHRLETA